MIAFIPAKTHLKTNLLQGYSSNCKDICQVNCSLHVRTH